MRRRSLRARLTLLVAAAVAAAIAAAAVACWLMLSDQLHRQLDLDLEQRPSRPGLVASLNRDCRQLPDPEDDQDYLFLHQVVRADGLRCVSGSQGVAVAPSDVELARVEGAELRDGLTDSGDRVRVLVRHAGDGLAFSVARQTDDIDRVLRQLAWLFAGAAACGVLLAASIGRLIARTALAPVDDLVETVSEIARTEDLSTPVPDGGSEEISRLSTAFNAMTAALASSRDRQRRLVADAGHELRTPLTSLHANIELLLRSEDTGRDLPSAGRRALLSDLREQVTELTVLTGDLLELARPSRPAERDSHAPVPLHTVVEDAARRAQLRGTSVFDVRVRPWFVPGEPASLERAVVNLLDNAVKFGPESSVITVELDAGRLTIRDRGPGIRAEDLPFVFDRFWRAPSARGVPGSGLGLAIAAQVVRDLGGEIDLSEPDGGGTEVTVLLPGSPER
ncbi:ATP-binding protein [Actinocorallia lasiicapitis]